jgi:hypothetical protein
MRQFDPTQRVICDATGNGELSALDATRILQLVVGLRSRLPVAELCGSDWAFLPDPAPAENQRIVALGLQSEACQPGAIAFEPLSGAATQQDFRAAVFGDCTANWQPSAPAAAQRAGAPAARLGRPTASSRRFLRLPIEVTGVAAFSALELTLRFDPAALRLRSVRLRDRSSGAFVRVARAESGSVRVALASAAPLSTGRRPHLVAVFERLQPGAAPVVAIDSASIDEQ